MNTHADKTQENKSQSMANDVSQKQSGGGSTFQFVDNRSEAVAQRKLQETANNSPKIKQATPLQAVADNYFAQQQNPIQKKENNTGLPDSLKSGIENLSGHSMDNVKVHYNSSKPAQLNAHAYAQGTDIHLGAGQEKHLPHEAWHVVQQKQGRVKPTAAFNGAQINDNAGLEKEADMMGTKALQMSAKNPKQKNAISTHNDDESVTQMADVIQRVIMSQVSNPEDKSKKGETLLQFVEFGAQLVKNGHKGVLDIGMEFQSTKSNPLQMRIKVGRYWHKVADKIRERVEDLTDNEAVIQQLIDWGQNGNREFNTWQDAVDTAQRIVGENRQGTSWGKILFWVVILFLIVTMVAMPFLGIGLQGFSSSRHHDDSPDISPDLLPQARNIEHSRAFRSLEHIVPFKHVRDESSFVDLFKTSNNPREVCENLEELGTSLERIGPELEEHEDAIRGSGSPSKVSGKEKEPDVEPVVELSNNPKERTEQIKRLNQKYLQDKVDVIKVHTHAHATQLGRGHQAAAVSVMEQLARDYCGTARLEIIIEAKEDAMVIFEHLLPGLDPTKDKQTLTYMDCPFTIIRHDPGGEVAKTSPFEKGVGIYPADDLEIWNGDVTNVDYSEKLRASMDVQKLIALNPHGWSDPESNRRFIDTGKQSYPITESTSSIYRGGIYKDLGDVPHSKISKVLADNIMDMVGKVQRGEAHLWVTYGLHYTESTGGFSMRPGMDIANTMVESAVRYQKAKGSSKPLVIVNLSKKTESHTKFIRDNAPALKLQGSTLAYEEMTKPMSITVSGGGSVIFVDMVDGIPKDWFSFIMDHATLPITYEGANTANLAHQLGKPFLSMRPEGTTEYIDIPGFEKGRKQLIAAGKALGEDRRGREPEVIVSKTLLELENPSSDVAKYVQAVLEKADTPESDQVTMAIAKLRETE